MICSKCGAENPEDSVFCNKCSLNLSGEVESEKKSKFTRKRIVVALSSVLVIICVLSGIVYFNSPVSAFKSEIRSNKSVEANKIYDEKIKGNADKVNSVNTFLKDDIADIEKSFVNEKIDYDKAKSGLETIKGTQLVSSDVNTAMEQINNLNNSRNAFIKAEGFLKNKDLVNAIKEYKNVIPEDKNYEKAKEQITNNVKQYKEQVLKNAEESAVAKDYSKSISLIKEATILIPNDSDLLTKLSDYEKQVEAEKKQKVEKAKAEQLVIVESAKIVVQDSTYKSLYPDMIQVIVQNASGKTIKNMKIGCLGYDANGYPIKIKTQYSFSGGGYEFVGNGEDVNIVAGGKFGQNNGFSLDESHGISKALSCVKTVTFYDGTTWDNPYYDYWIGQYKEKPLT